MLPGYNHNVPHLGRQFHIQTEDSGAASPHVITHLFDGGVILHTLRASYADALNSPDLRNVVTKLMQEQHKTMMRNLVRGELDGLLARVAGTSAPGFAGADPPPTAATENSSAATPASASESMSRRPHVSPSDALAPPAMIGDSIGGPPPPARSASVFIGEAIGRAPPPARSGSAMLDAEIGGPPPRTRSGSVMLGDSIGGPPPPAPALPTPLGGMLGSASSEPLTPTIGEAPAFALRQALSPPENTLPPSLLPGADSLSAARSGREPNVPAPTSEGTADLAALAIGTIAGEQPVTAAISPAAPPVSFSAPPPAAAVRPKATATAAGASSWAPAPLPPATDSATSLRERERSLDEIILAYLEEDAGD